MSAEWLEETVLSQLQTLCPGSMEMRFNSLLESVNTDYSVLAHHPVIEALT